MPLPIDALLQLMGGQKPQNMEDMMNSVSPLETRTNGLLVDQRVPSVFGRPPLQLRDQGGISGEMYNATQDGNPFPLLPAGDVTPFPKAPGPFSGK